VTQLTHPRTFLQLLMAAIALHSLGVGIGLVLHPAAILAAAGYEPVTEPFFPTQAGVFHFVVVVGYVLAAWNPDRNAVLIRYAVIIKAMATVFLVLYWILRPGLWAVLASGVVDGLMGVAIWWAYARWRRSASSERTPAGIPGSADSRPLA